MPLPSLTAAEVDGGAVISPDRLTAIAASIGVDLSTPVGFRLLLFVIAVARAPLPPGWRLHLGRVELVAAAAAASIFVLDCPRCTGRVPAWTDEPPARLPPPALEPAWPGT